MAPGGLWYATYVSGPAAFAYASSGNETGEIREYSRALPDEDEILKMYADQHDLTIEEVEQMRVASFTLRK